MPNKIQKPRIISTLINKFHKLFTLNIGTIIFGLIFIYMIFSAIIYLTSTHIESFQVTSGPLSSNETFTGLAVREEEVVKAESSGYVSYYARERSKINANGVVYGLSSTKTPETSMQLSQEDLNSIRSDMLSFSKGFTNSKFNNTYSFKYQLEGDILHYAGVTGNQLSATPTPAPTSDSEDGEETTETRDTVFNNQSSTVTLGNQTLCKASADGIVLYSKDGYEGKTVDSLTLDDFNQNNYHETDLKTKDSVKPGNDIYTLITDERWDLVIPVSEKQAARLANRSTIRVKFLKDDMTQSGDISIITIDGEKFAKINFNKGLVRYATDRFLNIELVTNTVTGLKIPLTSIVTKEFYTITDKYATKNDETEEIGFMLGQKTDKGENVRTFVSPTIYATTEETHTNTTTGESSTVRTYYVDKNAFQAGDVIYSKDGNSKFIVGDIGILEGVYCINKGYAVFRRISILDQNEEYAIVSKDTTYGLTKYDHIVRNANEVKEEDILY